MTESLKGLCIVTFENRRATEIAGMIRRYGGEVFSAPAMRDMPLGANSLALEFARRLKRGEVGVVIFLTGVGARYLADAIAAEMPKGDFCRALGSIVTVARGPKPAAVLREWGLAPTVGVPEPNTWRDILATIDQRVEIKGRRVVVQEYGEANPELLAGLAARGAEVMRVPVYRWALPEDLGPLREAIRRMRAGEVAVAVFTSATQVEHLFQVAGAEAAGPLRAALARRVVASVGPICSAALARHGIGVDIEPAHPKMGALVVALAERAPSLLAAKRG